MLRVRNHIVNSETTNYLAIPVGGKIISFTCLYDSDSLRCCSVGDDSGPMQQVRVLVVSTDSSIDAYVAPNDNLRFIDTAEDYNSGTLYHAFEVTAS